MPETKKGFFKHRVDKSSIIIFFIVIAIAILITYTYAAFRDIARASNLNKYYVEKHINAVMKVDRNCNDCHLGASFINLFSHPVVGNNDNVIRFIMDKARIKQW